METYQYKPLGPGQSIRYMVLEPGGEDDPLVCSLHESDVNSATFEAISYVWGTVFRDYSILCNGKNLLITHNLQNALRQVRRSDAPRALWADSICVNQSDFKERNHQVAIMGQIYSKAQKVLLCIGPDHKTNAQNATALANDVSTMILETFETVGYSPASFPYPEGDGMLGMDPRWSSFATMLETSWFRRGWVVQESGLAKHAVILWGDWQIPWDSFMRTWFLADRLNVFTFPSNSLLPTLDKIRKALNIIHRDVFLATHRQESVAWYPTSSLALTTNHLEIMRDSHDLLLADQRDRVYAFHALAQRITPSTFQSYTPNYELSINDTYLDFARNYLLDKSDLTLLNYVHHDADSITDELPSWCPRWDLNLFDAYISTPSSAIIQTSTTPSGSVNILPADILQVRGVIIDSIAATSTWLSREATIDDISLLWQSCRTNWGSSMYPAGGNIVAFLDCLTIGHVRGEIDAWYGNYAHYLYQLFLRSKEPDIPEDLVSLVNDTPRNPNNITDFITDHVHNRKFAITERGYYGLVPGIAKEGDWIVAISGTRSPVVLREQSSKHPGLDLRRTSYRIVGEAYIGSKHTTTRRLGGKCFVRIPMVLGTGFARDWEHLELEEQDIFLV